MPDTEPRPRPAAATEELWNAKQVAAVMGISATEVGRRLKRGEPPLPRYHAGARADALWVPEDVRLYAAATDHALIEPGEHPRLPIPRWTHLEPLPEPLPRKLDRVVTLPLRRGYLFNGPHPVHVRIWQGAVGGTERTVCLLAPVDGHAVQPAQAALGQIIATELVQAGLLTADTARRARWFALMTRDPYRYLTPGADPQRLVYLSLGLPDTPGLLRRWRTADEDMLFDHPRTLPVQLADLARLIGEDVECYPPDTHTPEVVARYAAGQRPVVLDWDPQDLAGTTEHIRVLRTWALELVRAGDRRAAAAVTDAATTLAALATETDSQYERTYEEEDRTVVDRRIHRLDAAERDELLLFARDSGGATFGHWLRLHRAAAALATALGHDTATDRRAALTAAVTTSDSMLRPIAAAHADRHGGWPLRLTTHGNDDAAAYLATCAWYGPKEEDTETAARLRDALWEDERENARFGYAPDGRLVLAAADRSAFAATCPASPYAARHLTQDFPGFTSLSDGRRQFRPFGPAALCGHCGMNRLGAAALPGGPPNAVYCQECSPLLLVDPTLAD
ncbi:hypothetical protein [Streptomyces syringium]|uniref:hypothetical protein n=1 Tax=Streptomyces syringium TaxID=76729 RepID=UPI0037CF9CA2